MNYCLFGLVIALALLQTTTYDSLVNTKASAEAHALYQRLINYNGHFILSGQTSFHYNDLAQKVKRTPLVQAFDMQNYSPHNPWYNWQPTDDGTVANAINWFRQTNGKGIVSFHWHWFSPMGGNLRTSTFYTEYTNFDVSKAVTQGTQQYNATIRDIDAIAVQLKRLQNEKIPVIWRPLHEAGGKWFWWGSKTSAEAIKLYAIMYDRLTNYHNINNLIWTWSTPEPDWYPGNQRVDMFGYDSYPGAYNYNCRVDIYNNMKKIVGDHKMLHLTENGPIPDISNCWQQGAKWGYFLSWSDLVFSQNSDQHLIDIYQNNPLVKTL